MVHGRATRSIDLNTNSTGPKGSCFLRDRHPEGASVVCAVALAKSSAPISFALDIDPAKYGLKVPPNSPGVTVTNLLTGAPLGTFKDNVKYGDTLHAYDLRVVLLSL